MRSFNAPFIVVLRARPQVFEASRHEASFKTVLPPIGAVAPVTSVPAWGYAGLTKRFLRLFYAGSKKTFCKSRKVSFQSLQKAFLCIGA